MDFNSKYWALLLLVPSLIQFLVLTFASWVDSRAFNKRMKELEMADDLLRRQEEAWLNPPEDEDETVEPEVDPTDLPGYEED